MSSAPESAATVLESNDTDDAIAEALAAASAMADEAESVEAAIEDIVSDTPAPEVVADSPSDEGSVDATIDAVEDALDTASRLAEEAVAMVGDACEPEPSDTSASQDDAVSPVEAVDIPDAASTASTPAEENIETAPALSAGGDPKRELIARLKGVHAKVGRTVTRIMALESENHDLGRNLTQAREEIRRLESENDALEVKVKEMAIQLGRLTESEAAHETIDEIEKSLESAGV